MKRNFVIALLLLGSLIGFLPLLFRICILSVFILSLFLNWDEYSYQQRYQTEKK